MQAIWEDFRDWMREPFRADMGVGGWFFFLGMVIVLMAAWGWFISRLPRAS